MKIVICGGSGFIGRNLARYLLAKGAQVTILDRSKSGTASPDLTSFEVDLLRPDLFEPAWFDGAEAVVNLSGKDIFTFWSPSAKELILQSRVTVNKNLVSFISTLTQKPKAFISASAAGYYGNRGEAELGEGEPPGEGFLADVCVEWEAAARDAERVGMRSVQVRTAPVLLKGGGLLKQVMKSMRFGFTFRFGSGDQWFPWVHMTDLIRIYHLAITDETLSGPVNACAPEPVRYSAFLGHLTRYKKALVIPFPVGILEMFLQETADVLLFSQRMRPAKLLDKNFAFSFPTIEDAFKEIFAG